jgi:hypothetical protein
LFSSAITAYPGNGTQWPNMLIAPLGALAGYSLGGYSGSMVIMLTDTGDAAHGEAWSVANGVTGLQFTDGPLNLPQSGTTI